MSPDHFEIQNCLTRLEIEINARQEAEEREKARKEAESMMLRAFIMLGCPVVVPADLIPPWMQGMHE